jgi:hypothetical protein
MGPYRGRTLHKIKTKNKPVAEGFKIWVLGDNGYISDWLQHSQRDSPEGIPKKGLWVNQLCALSPVSCHVLARAPDRLRLGSQRFSQEVDEEARY